MPAARTLCLVLASALLAPGCFPQDAGTVPPTDTSATPAPPTDFSELALEATKTTGVVRGVVVDLAVRPIPQALVNLNPGNLSMVTDDAGRFGFDGLDPGAYVARAGKDGYVSAQASVQVVAGVDEPRAVVLALDRVAGTEPYVDALVWDGFMECSLIAANFFFTGCGVGDYPQDDSRRIDAIGTPPRFLQSELMWRQTQALGQNLCMKHYALDAVTGSDFEPLTDQHGETAGACGSVPVVQSFSNATLNATRVGEGKGIERVVWVAYAVDGVLGLSFEQRFTVYTHIFHNFAPRDGWVFVNDGPHPVP